MQGGAGKAMGFGQSRAKMLTETHGRVTFEDVAGVDGAKQDLQEIVEFLCGPSKFQRHPMPVPVGAKVSTVRYFASCRLSPAPASGA
jgi:cell division protease FtsH